MLGTRRLTAAITVAVAVAVAAAASAVAGPLPAAPHTYLTGITRAGCVSRTVTGTGPQAHQDVINQVFVPALHATCPSETVLDDGGGDYLADVFVGNRSRLLGFTDEPTHDETLDLHHVPVAVVPLSVITNLPCAGANPVRLSSPVLAKIYDGVLTTWDKALLIDNPKPLWTACLNVPIVPIWNYDNYDTTYTFTDYLSKRNPEYAPSVQTGTLLAVPTASNIKSYGDDDGVIGDASIPGSGVLGTPNSIGYARTNDVIKAGASQVQVDNSLRSFSTWSPGACTTAAKTAVIPPSTLNSWSHVSFTDAPVGYGICGFTYDIAHQYLRSSPRGPDGYGYAHGEEEAQTVVDFLQAALSPAGQAPLGAAVPGYDPLPLAALAVAQEGVSLITDVPRTPATGVARVGCATQTVSGPGSIVQEKANDVVFQPALHATCQTESVVDTGGDSWLGIRSQLSRTAPIGFTDEPESPTVWAQTIAGSAKNASPIHHIPMGEVAVSVILNLPCAGEDPVNLSSPVIAGMYDGVYTTWGQALARDNPAALATACANVPIVLIARSDVSSATYLVKDYLSKRNAEYIEYEQDDHNTRWPGEDARRVVVHRFSGTDGVIGSSAIAGAGVMGTPNSIGYAEAYNVFQSGAVQAAIDSPDHTFHTYQRLYEGDCESAAESATTPSSTLDNWSRVSLTDQSGLYPICGFSYALVFQNLRTAVGASPAVAQTIVDHLSTALTLAGQNPLGPVPPVPGYETLALSVDQVAQQGVSLISDN